jgi:hypothetical protein
MRPLPPYRSTYPHATAQCCGCPMGQTVAHVMEHGCACDCRCHESAKMIARRP